MRTTLLLFAAALAVSQEAGAQAPAPAKTPTMNLAPDLFITTRLPVGWNLTAC